MGGYYCYLAGALELIYFSETNTGRDRSIIEGQKLRLDQQKKWFAKMFVRAKTEFKKKELALDAIQHLIDDILDGNIQEDKYTKTPEIHNVQWFERIISFNKTPNENHNYGRITGAFRDLSRTEIARLAALDDDDIPSVTLPFSHP